MNIKDSKIIAKTITNEQLQEMFNNAKTGVKDWTKVSSVNKSITKGRSWNWLYGYFDVSRNIHPIGKVNMIREFGEFLPESLKPIKIKRPKTKTEDLIHQEPKF